MTDNQMKAPVDYFLFASLLAMLVLAEPALANKFETIGSGVAGSFHIKRESLQTGLLACGIALVVFALLAVIVPRTNAAFLNYVNWKASSAIMGIIGCILLVFYFLV